MSCHHASSKRIALFKCFIFICFDILVLPIKYTPQCSEAFTQFLVSNDFLLYVVWFVSGSSGPRHPCGCQMHSFYDNYSNWPLKYFFTLRSIPYNIYEQQQTFHSKKLPCSMLQKGFHNAGCWCSEWRWEHHWPSSSGQRLSPFVEVNLWGYLWGYNKTKLFKIIFKNKNPTLHVMNNWMPLPLFTFPSQKCRKWEVLRVQQGGILQWYGRLCAREFPSANLAS